MMLCGLQYKLDPKDKLDGAEELRAAGEQAEDRRCTHTGGNKEVESRPCENR